MNWYRIKTVLIVLFALINIYLAFTLFFAAGRENAITQEVCDTAVSMLSKNGIAVDKKQIPLSVSPMANITLKNVLTDGFLEAAAEKGCQVGKSENQFSIFAPAILSYEGNLESVCAQWLGDLGIDLSGAKFSANGSQFVITQSHRGFPIFESRLTVETDGEKPLSVKGTWFTVSQAGSYRMAVKNPVYVFGSFLGDAGGAEALEDITLGYSGLNFDSFYSEITAVPVWRLTDNAGKAYYYDARQ